MLPTKQLEILTGEDDSFSLWSDCCSTEGPAGALKHSLSVSKIKSAVQKLGRQVQRLCSLTLSLCLNNYVMMKDSFLFPLWVAGGGKCSETGCYFTAQSSDLQFCLKCE